MTAIRRYWRLSLLLAVIAAAIFIFIVHDNSEAKQKIKPVPHKSMYQVTLFQENSFPVHEKMKQGIIAALESKGFTEKKNIHLEIINGQGNLMQMETQAKKIVHEKPDLIISVGTEATKAVVKETEVIPVVGVGAFQMKSEPAFEDKYNLTGIGDMPLILNQVRMASKIFPVKSLGIIFNPEDEEAVTQLNMLREVGEKKGIRLFEIAFDKNTEIESQVKKFKGNVDAVYIPADEKIQTSFEKIVSILRSYKIPIIGENTEMVKKGALLSVSAEYYRMGFSGGRIASELLKGEKKPFEIPITKQMDPDWIVNMSVAKELGIVLPNDIWQKARKLYLYDGQNARP